MTPDPLVGQRVPRPNDARLLTAGGRYVDDLTLPGMLHAAIVRSPTAHGMLRGLDRSGLTAPTELVLGPDQIRARTGPTPVLWHLPGQFQHERPVIDDRVRFVGEPVAIVVAATRSAARDAVDQLYPEIDELPALVDPLVALAPDAPLLYPDAGTNLMAAWDTGDTAEHVDAVMADCARTLTTTLRIGRLAGAPMECRGLVAAPDPTGKLTVWISTQAPHAVRDTIAQVCGLPQHRIRVIAPDVGGGFGVKDHIYEDELMVCLAALELNRPVKWIEDRYESLVATHGARDERYQVDVGFEADGRLRALRVDAVRANGAYLSIFGGGPLFTMGGTLPGPYTWEAVRTTARLVATTTTPLGAYRGFGQTQSCFVRERVVDLVAADLGLDPAEVRLRNMIRPDQQPYALRTPPITYDNGDYPRALERARELATAWPDPPDDGRARGIGYCSYVQMAAVGPSIGNRAIGLDIGGYETTTVRMERDGTVRLLVGVTPQGQGHETTFAQLAADRLGVAIDRIELIHSDTDVTPYSAYGTAASRSIAVGGGSTVRATEALATKIRAIAADLLEAAPDDIVLADGRATVAGTTVGVALADVANRAWQGWELPDGLDPGLVASATYDPEAFTFSYATHVARAAVDRATGAIEIERYAVVHDCGTMVNPTIVEGQIHGGIAQGLGAALLEQMVHGDDGQPLTTTFLDYTVPTSDSMPPIEIEHTITPSPFTPGGMKGMGEGGTNGAFVCVVNAVAAAVPDVAARITTTPVTPTTLWALLHP